MSSTSRRRFQCTYGTCTRSFTRNAALQAHVRGTHYREKHFKCGLCDKEFIRADDRNKHKNNVHKLIRPFCCEAEGCKKAYATRYELNRHFLKFACHARAEAHPQTIDDTEELIERLCEQIEWAIEYCHTRSVMINLSDLYADIANRFRRLRQPTFDSLCQALKSVLDAMITQEVKQRDQQMSELKAVYHQECQAFAKYRRLARQVDQGELQAVERLIPTPKIWRDFLWSYERTERERMLDEQSQMHGEDDERSRGTREEVRLAAAVDAYINTLVHEQMQKKLPKLSLEWMKDSLRAALSAHEFCGSVQSGHTNSTLEAVRPQHENPWPIMAFPSSREGESSSEEEEDAGPLDNDFADFLVANSGSAGSSEQASGLFFCRVPNCESAGFLEHEDHQTHVKECHLSYMDEYLDWEEVPRAPLPSYDKQDPGRWHRIEELTRDLRSQFQEHCDITCRQAVRLPEESL